MPRRCYNFKTPNGINAIVCGSNLGEACNECGCIGDYLCDYEVAPGQTCNASMCDDHFHEVDDGVHYCTRHWLKATNQ